MDVHYNVHVIPIEKYGRSNACHTITFHWVSLQFSQKSNISVQVPKARSTNTALREKPFTGFSYRCINKSCGQNIDRWCGEAKLGGSIKAGVEGGSKL